jgi:hypothetical protein
MRLAEVTLELLVQSHNRSLLRELVIALMVVIVSSTLLPSQIGAGESGLSLAFSYRLHMPRGWSGNLSALLDPEGHYLYVFDTGESGVHVLKVDWRNERTEKVVTYPDPACNWAMTLSWIPHTRFIHMRSCGVHYVLDSETLEIERKMLGEKWHEGFIFSPTGNMVLVSEYDEEQKAFRRVLREFPSWTEIGPWNSPGQAERFTDDGRYLVARLSRSHESKPIAVECGLAFYEIPTGKLATKWLVDPQKVKYCGGASPILIPKSPYLAVDLVLARGLVVADLWTGTVVYELEVPDVSIQTVPNLSPNGRYVVAGGWDDPQDKDWSRDFVIWDLETRKIVYQTPKYRSVWGRNTAGREVYPRFSDDGKYLIIVEERGVELHRISLTSTAE